MESTHFWKRSLTPPNFHSCRDHSLNRTNYATSQDIWAHCDRQGKYRFSTKNSSCLRLTRQLNKRFFVSWERKWNLKIYFYVVVKNCVPRIHLAVYKWKYYMETNVIIISKEETDWLICHFEWLYGWRTNPIAWRTL